MRTQSLLGCVQALVSLEGVMDLEQRLETVTRGTVEIIQRGELENLLGEKRLPRAYWGFECSGKRASACTV